MARGWRIYEGGGGVKGKILVLCFEWRSEQAPLTRSWGDASAATLLPWRLNAVSLSMPSELQLTHLSGLVDQDVDSQPGAS